MTCRAKTTWWAKIARIRQATGPIQICIPIRIGRGQRPCIDGYGILAHMMSDNLEVPFFNDPRTRLKANARHRMGPGSLPTSFHARIARPCPAAALLCVETRGCWGLDQTHWPRTIWGRPLYVQTRSALATGTQSYRATPRQYRNVLVNFREKARAINGEFKPHKTSDRVSEVTAAATSGLNRPGYAKHQRQWQIQVTVGDL